MNCKRFLSSRILILGFLFAINCMVSCKEDSKTKIKIVKPVVEHEYEFDLLDIQSRGVLKAITTYSPTGYFLYRGETMGFDYELLSKLAENLNVDLEIVLAENVDSLIPMLKRGDGDIIAIGYTITSDRKETVSFTDPYLITHQTLVQKKPSQWQNMTLDNIKAQLITDVIELISDTVSVRKNTSYYQRLVDLSRELGDTIHINVLPGELTDEDIITQIAEGTLKYAFIDQHIANIHKSYYPEIDVATPVSLSQRIAWAVRKSSPELLLALNKHLVDLKRKPDYNVIYRKYFENQRQFKRRLNSEYFTEVTGKISKYDGLVKQNASHIGWDWRLLKALIFQESMFKADNQSWAGATGLMQLMPATALELGVKNSSNPEENVKAGVNYLKRMYDYWDVIPDSTQRIKFAMASYNSGYGHVKDAQKLAKKFKKDTLMWDKNVDYYMLQLSKPEFYNDPSVEFGYVRGHEPYNYIIDIFNRYENYKDFVAK